MFKKGEVKCRSAVFSLFFTLKICGDFVMHLILWLICNRYLINIIEMKLGNKYVHIHLLILFFLKLSRHLLRA